MSQDAMRDDAMMELFRQEAEAQTAVLARDLLLLERNPQLPNELESCMRAAHSLKGAARIVGLEDGVRVAHVMEDCLVAAQEGRLRLTPAHIDALLYGSDLLLHIAEPVADGETDRFVARLESLLAARSPTEDAAPAITHAEPDIVPPDVEEPAEVRSPEAGDRMLRVTAEHLNRLLELSGKSLVELRQMKPVIDTLERLRRQQTTALRMLAAVQERLYQSGANESDLAQLADVGRHLGDSHDLFTRQAAVLDEFVWQANQRTRRLYDTALACRMRPFADVTPGQARMVRDLGRSLGKQVRLEVEGESAQVDREVLKKLEAPLIHLLRNAVDHGIELPEERLAAGKPAEGKITLRAYHHADKLRVELEDDGRGVDPEALRAAIIRRGMTNAATAARMPEEELLSFLFLPGFSMRDTVTDVSGRGVGLDAVHHDLRELRGVVHVRQTPGQGACFVMEVPLTLSIIRCLVVEIGNEAYAFPLAHIERMLAVPRDAIVSLDGRQHFWHLGTAVGVASAAQLLQRPTASGDGDEVPVVMVREHARLYGLVVDRLIGEQTLAALPLDPRLGKIQDVTAGAVLEDGRPALILDVEDMVRSVENLAGNSGLQRVDRRDAQQAARKRVLVVDDSLTVRELERKLLQGRGYDVSVAVDGMEGWNQVRAGSFDLVVTDIDMPRMNGIELVSLIRRDSRLQSLPVMVVSYKDREEDRRRGLDAGADYYLAKASFHDEALLDAVAELIGEAEG